MNSQIIIISLGVLVLVIYTIHVLSIAIQKNNWYATEKKLQRLQSLYYKLESGKNLTQADVYHYAKKPLTREPVFRLLQAKNLLNVFPKEFYTIEKAAESNLVIWLGFPTELGASPDEIEHFKKVAIDGGGENDFFYYHIYRFRMNSPHWAAQNGWMLGVVGPYFDDSKPYDHPNSTFSRFNNKLDLNFPDAEAKWVHENISLPFIKTT